jgi:nucleoside-diphosphate-sugar epimerase
VVEGFLRSIAAQQEHNIVGPFNLGSEGRVTIRDIAETVVEVSGKDIELSFDPTMKTALWGQAVICDRARELLYGWEPQVDLKEGLRRSYQHIQERLERGETC